MNDALMNLLVDYYPEVQFQTYGSGATRKNVLPYLKQLHLGYVCIYAKGHSGYTTWPSSLGTKHAMLGQDMPKFYRQICREAGTRLVLYYSGLLDGQAALRHPEWRMKRPDGSDQRQLLHFPFVTCYANCPHSDYFDQWVTVQIRELIENYQPDGIWVDGDWPQPCHCHRCQTKFAEYCGGRNPYAELKHKLDFTAQYQKFWNQVTHRWRTRFAALVKSLKPDCLYSAGNVSPRQEFLAPFDWRSGDFFFAGLVLSPRYGEDDAVVWNFGRSVRCLCLRHEAWSIPGHSCASRSKTLDRMLQESATVAATGGGGGLLDVFRRAMGPWRLHA